MDKKIDKRLLKKPLYLIGDIVVYPWELGESSMIHLEQSVIIESYGLLESAEKEDRLAWYYITKHTDKESDDSLLEDDILYKL